MTDTSASSFFKEPPQGDLPRWVIAGIAVVALHVAIAAFLLNRKPEEPPPAAAEVIEIDMEPPAPEMHAAPQAEKIQEATTPTPEEKPAPEPEPVQPPPPEPEPVKPPPPPEPPPPPPPPPPPEPPPPTPEPPPPVAVAPTPVPDLPVLPKVEAPIEQAKPDPAIEMAREQEIKHQQDVRREKQRQERVEKERERRKEEAKRKAEQGRRAAERQAAASRERAAQAGRDSHNSVRHEVSGAELSAWKAGVAARIRSSAQNYADQGASSSSVSFYVGPSGQISRVSGSGPSASAVRAVGSVEAPPDGVGHPVSVVVRFK